MQVTYDLECYPNVFLGGFLVAGEPLIYEISDRCNHARELWTFLSSVSEMIGFNNMAYDWPLLNSFLEGRHTPDRLYEFNNMLFESMRRNEQHRHTIWNPRIPQIDLFRIHHFNNRARMTSLKTLEFNMRLPNIADLPFKPGTCLTWNEIDDLRTYLKNDLAATYQFYEHSADEIEFRRGLEPRAMVQSNGTIGKKFFINALEKAGVKCFDDDRNPNQSPRPHGVALSDVIFPWIEGDTPAVQQAIDVLRNTHVGATKGTFKHTVRVGNLDIDIALGGIHGSVSNRHVTGGYILDVDVTSYYPQLAIQHRLYPEHLTERFCDVYANLFAERQKHPKGSTTNLGLKLALNSVYGDSNSAFGPFYDPKYMLSITINGQLLLVKLAEQLVMHVPGVELIQVNTDGMTIRYQDAAQADAIAQVLTWWQSYSRMNLEAVQYSDMWIRDVNNYIARGVDGKVKRKGVYDYELEWHKDFSKLVVPKCVEQHLLTGQPIDKLIMQHDDPFDFMCRVKAPRNSWFELSDGTMLEGTVRYYISTRGKRMVKRMPPLKGKTEYRTLGVHAEGQAECLGDRGAYSCSLCGYMGSRKSDIEEHNTLAHSWKVKECNQFDGHMPNDIDYLYYIRESDKLICFE